MCLNSPEELVSQRNAGDETNMAPFQEIKSQLFCFLKSLVKYFKANEQQF